MIYERVEIEGQIENEKALLGVLMWAEFCLSTSHERRTRVDDLATRTVEDGLSAPQNPPTVRAIREISLYKGSGGHVGSLRRFGRILPVNPI